MSPMSIILPLCLLAAAPTAAPIPSDAARGVDLVEQARRLEEDGRYDAALGLYREAMLLDPSDVGVRVAMARSWIALDRLGRAEAILDQALADAPDDAEGLALLGEVYYRTERLPQAVSAWRRSLLQREDAALRRRLARAEREMDWTSSYRDAGSSRFILRYESDVRSEDEAGLLHLLEEQYDLLRRRLGGAPTGPIVVVLYPREDFHEATLAPDRAIGLYDGKVRLPARGIELGNPQLRATLLHELTHAFLVALGGDAVPRWLHEGLAEVMEGSRLGPREELLADAYLRERGRDWERGFSYPRALSFVQYLIDRGGYTDLRWVLVRLGEGMTVDDALRRVYGASYAELADAWGEALVERWK